MRTIASVINTPSQKMKRHKCKFDNNKQAAKMNGKWLKHYKWDLEFALTKQKGTMLETGSEFGDVATLEPLWEHHNHWHKMKEIVTTGLTYPLTDIPETERKEDLDFMIQRGNHKSAQTPEVPKPYKITTTQKSRMGGCYQYPNPV